MILLIQYTLIYASCLILVALGGMFSEHSGVINIGLEGIMVIGALGGALTMMYMPEGVSPFLIVVLTVLMAALAGLAFSMLLSVAAINFKADQTLVGTAMNILATAVAAVVVKAINTTASHGDNVSAIVRYIEEHEAFIVRWNLGEKSFFEFNWFFVITIVALIVSAVILYKTKFGLRLYACGEHPQAADAAGVNVAKMRYSGVMISGVLGGIGGLVYIASANSSWDFKYGVAGAGFLALAVMIFGEWKPWKIAGAAIIFGLFRALSNVYTAFPLLMELNIPSNVYNMLPYIISLLVLAFTSKSSRAPKAEGIPFEKGQR
ncbi:MAG: ABC transporter permease [Clostridia bacterium]|nr:ABC transporter permease [Clostridia bacterium]